MDLTEQQFKDLIDDAALAARVTAELRADVFRELTKHDPVNSSAAGIAAAEKRTTARIGVQPYVVTVRPILRQVNFAAPPIRGLMRDISAEGIGLLMPDPIFWRFELCLPAPEGRALVVMCTPKSQRHLGNGQWHVGGQFDNLGILEDPDDVADAA